MEAGSKELGRNRARFSIVFTTEDLEIENELEINPLASDRSEGLTPNYKFSAPRGSVDSSYTKVNLKHSVISKYVKLNNTTEQLLCESPRKIPKLTRAAVFESGSKLPIKNSKKNGKKTFCSVACVIV